jgi:hypothetical protein
VSRPSGIKSATTGSLSKLLEEVRKGVEIIGIVLIWDREGNPVEIVETVSAGEPVECAPKGLVVHVDLLVVNCGAPYTP